MSAVITLDVLRAASSADFPVIDLGYGAKLVKSKASPQHGAR